MAKSKVLTSNSSKKKRSNDENEFVDDKKSKKRKEDNFLKKNSSFSSSESVLNLSLQLNSTTTNENDQQDNLNSLPLSPISNNQIKSNSKKDDIIKSNKLLDNSLNQKNDSINSNKSETQIGDQISLLIGEVQSLRNELNDLKEKQNELTIKSNYIKLAKKNSDKVVMVDFYHGGPKIHLERLVDAKECNSINVFISKIFTAVVPLIDSYRYNNTGTAAKREDRKTNLSSNKFKLKYIVILCRGCIENLKHYKKFSWLKSAKLDEDGDEDDLDDLNEKELIELIKKYDEDLVKQVKSAISRKLNYLNQLFRFMRTNTAKIDNHLLKRFHLQLIDISNFCGFDEYNLDRKKFAELDALIDNFNLGVNGSTKADLFGEQENNSLCGNEESNDLSESGEEDDRKSEDISEANNGINEHEIDNGKLKEFMDLAKRLGFDINKRKEN